MSSPTLSVKVTREVSWGFLASLLFGFMSQGRPWVRNIIVMHENLRCVTDVESMERVLRAIHENPKGPLMSPIHNTLFQIHCRDRYTISVRWGTILRGFQSFSVDFPEAATKLFSDEALDTLECDALLQHLIYGKIRHD